MVKPLNLVSRISEREEKEGEEEREEEREEKKKEKRRCGEGGREKKKEYLEPCERSDHWEYA